MAAVPFHTYNTISNKIDIINTIYHSYKTIKQFEWIVDASITDFFIENQWEKLNRSWQDVLQQVEPTTLANFISYNQQLQGNIVWPLSMLALRKVASIYNIPRKFCLSTTSTRKTENLERQFHKTNIQNMFYKKVKRKKKHEIEIMAKVCYEIASQSNVSYIVDIGSGLGHLARYLAYCYNMKVCTIERDELLTQKARELDILFRKKFAAYLKTNEVIAHDPVHVTYNIESDFNIDKFLSIVKPAFGISNDTELNCGIVGLHPCGNLGPILLRLYTSSENIQYICNAGCCYMKLTTNDKESSTQSYGGFPLSEYCNRAKCNLSYYSRELACHAIENYSERLSDPLEYSFLRVHCLRATLEDMLARKWPNAVHSYVNSVKNINGLSFYKYCMLAVKGKTDVDITEADCVKDTRVIRNLQDWSKVLSFHGLRTMFAPLIETVILFDRVLYLLERGCNNSKINCLFNPKISPRSHIISSFK